MKQKIKENVVGIIGGNGAMGQFFVKVFENAGIEVLISDLDTDLSNEELIQRSDIVIFSVPLHLSEQIIRANIQFLREDQLVMDLTSLKSNQVNLMLQSQAQVIGLHPMFGPSISSNKGQVILYIPARTTLETEMMEFLENFGFTVKNIEAKQHDHLMAVIQVLIHFKAIVLGKALEKLGVSIEETLEISSPVYKMELNMIGRIFAQDPKLYGAIEIMNPETPKILETLEESFHLYRNIVLNKDMDKFVEEFEKSSQHMGDYCKIALDKSSEIFKDL